MGKVDFKDVNNNVLAVSSLPDGFKCDATISVEGKPGSQAIMLELKAERKGCLIQVRSGRSYLINKMPQPQIYYYMEPANRPDNFPKELPDIRDELDDNASFFLNTKVSNGSYFELSDKFKTRFYPELKESVKVVADDLYTGSLASPVPIGGVLRNYLSDGGLAFYELDKRYLAFGLYRLGVEIDIVQNKQGIDVVLSDKPFSKADIMMNASASIANIRIPLVFHMFSDRKEDLKIFMNFMDDFAFSKQFLEFKEQLYRNNQQLIMNQASMARMNDQAFINYTWQMNAQQLASMDRVRDSLSHDMDRFHEDLDKRMKDFDSRINVSTDQGESFDDRIQRQRHETMMDVNTYTRNDGTTVEYDSRADRVFESDLDPIRHFGTEHYLSDYVPDGWHELNKK